MGDLWKREFKDMFNWYPMVGGLIFAATCSAGSSGLRVGGSARLVATDVLLNCFRSHVGLQHCLRSFRVAVAVVVVVLTDSKEGSPI